MRLFKLFASDASVEVPVRTERGFLPNYYGIAAVRAYYKDTPKTFRFDRYFDIVVHETSG